MKTVFVNGCFDILHRGHIELFKYAASLGDTLIVAIDSDERVKSSKGLSRPFNNQDDRVFMLESIKYIDKVCIFNSTEELENLIKYVSPDLLVVGSDWVGKEIVGGEYAKRICFFDRIPGYSTTKIIESSSDR